MAEIAAVTELTDVLPQMFGRDVNVGALDRQLEARPMALKRVYVMDSLHPFIGGVIDSAVIIGRALKVAVRRPLIGTDGAAALHVSQDDGFKSILASIRDGASAENAVTLHHAEHNGLTGATTGFSPSL